LNNAPPESLGFKSADGQREAVLEAKQKEVDQGIVQLESLLNATVDKDFDKFEIYTLRNILAVGHEEEQLAGWVQLDHYKNLDLSKAQTAPTPEQVQMQRRKLHETTKLNTMLKAEEARNAAVLEQLRALTGNGANVDKGDAPFGFLTPPPSAEKDAQDQQSQEKIQHVVSQLPAIKQHIAQLKNSLQSLPNARNRREDEDSAEAKRRDYLFAKSRRALERRGVELEGTTSLGGSSGRKVATEEVEGMEAVVQALGGAEGIRRDRDDSETEE
jgi:kinetochore protein Mis12/MTW1